LEKRVQQIKVERGISFPDARKAVLSEQSANTSSRRTAAPVVSSATTVTSKVTKKNTTSVSIQTDLTWPEGNDSPVPVKHNGKSQTTQTYKKQDNTKPGNTTSPSPPAKVEMLQHLQLVKAVRGTLTPDRPLLNLQRKMLNLE